MTQFLYKKLLLTVTITLAVAVALHVEDASAETMQVGEMYNVVANKHKALCTKAQLPRDMAESITKSELVYGKSLSVIDKELSTDGISTSGFQFLGSWRRHDEGEEQKIIVELCVTVHEHYSPSNSALLMRHYTEQKWWVTLCDRESAQSCVEEAFLKLQSMHPTLTIDELKSNGWRFLLFQLENVDTSLVGGLIASATARPIPPEWDMIRKGEKADDPRKMRPVRGRVQLSADQQALSRFGIIAIPAPTTPDPEKSGPHTK